jgi:DNA gyrase subunit A
MDSNIFDLDRIKDIDLKKTMEDSYIDYAMSVIVARALPDVRDGLKPVQRRILYSMIELNNGPDKPHRKCARIVGDTMGKYHPHGDSSIYDALVKLAQDFNTRYPLVDGHGNFGSVDGDSPAAMRYTEARLSKISMEMLSDINKDTVDFQPNFDETEKEPVVLPSRFPNLLVNGTTGIAVGMATNIPPHNLREVIAAVVKIIDNRINEDRETSIEEVMDIVKGPDFPTGAVIVGRRGINDAYRTGRGKIRVQAVTDIEAMPNGKTRIIVTELPYMVNKARLIKSIADLVKDKRIDGITDLRDESDRQGMRICIELRRDVNANIVLNKLFKHTQMMDTFGCTMLALVDNQPKILNLKQMLEYYLKHQEDVVTRRTKYDLNKALERAHILEGLLIALDNIDEVVHIIRNAPNVAEAKNGLIERFGLSDAQSQAIVDMRLRTLTGLERDKLQKEYEDLKVTIEHLRAILADEKLLLGVIREELMLISNKYGDDRRTKISVDEEELKDEDMIPDSPVVIAMTNLGYIKRMSHDNFHSQHRGGKGIKGMSTIDEDYIDNIFMTSNHHFLMFFTNKGKVYRIKTYEIPEASRTSRGVAIVNLLQMEPDEKVTTVLPIKEYDDETFLLMATRSGMVKKTPVREYMNIRKVGLTAIKLKENDELIEVRFSKGDNDVFLVTRCGMCIRFNEKDIRPMGRIASGVIGINLRGDDSVVSMQVDSQGDKMLFVTEKGMGKRTLLSEFSIHHRGGMGMKCYRITDKTGEIVGAKAMKDDREIMLITTEGIIIRMASSDVSVNGRVASGVKVMNLAEGVKVAGIAKVSEEATLSSADEASANDEADEAYENEAYEANVDEAYEDGAENGSENAAPDVSMDSETD